MALAVLSALEAMSQSHEQTTDPEAPMVYSGAPQMVVLLPLAFFKCPDVGLFVLSTEPARSAMLQIYTNFLVRRGVIRWMLPAAIAAALLRADAEGLFLVPQGRDSSKMDEAEWARTCCTLWTTNKILLHAVDSSELACLLVQHGVLTQMVRWAESLHGSSLSSEARIILDHNPQEESISLRCLAPRS